ncbi:MAG: hypothetical protein V1679_00270, partial [Candidatus Peregrinibacteria bacterium]
MKKECGQCGKGFEVSDEDLAFYGGLSPEVPPPSLCFFCRHQKRLAFRNEINLYHRKCDFSGEKIISMYSPDKEYRVYDQHIWWSDKWDPLEYGRDYDFNRGFFEQYAELQKEVPRMSFNNINAENSDYCNLALDNKDCYLIFTADNNEKCAYLRFSDKNYACFDCDYTYDSIECYECLDVEKGNRCLYCHKCVNSSGLVFCYNMIGCHDCIGCANLRNKRYYIFNREYSKSEFDKKRAELGWSRLKSEYAEFLRSQPRKYLDIVNCENSLGDNLRDCKNAYMCYNSVGLEDCRYMMNCYFAKDCYDWDFVAQKGSERCHEMASCAYNMVNCHFCSGCWENCSDFYYCELCLNSSDLFGCISLRHKKYCILNKQYSREEYFELRGRIIEKMRADGEWGEFFPYSLSTYAYNETVAGEYFPLDEAEVLKRGWKWHEEEEGGGGLKIIDIERKFCEKVGVPLPKVAWKERQRLRMKLRNPWMLWARKCD